MTATKIISDPMEAQIITVYLVQKLGEATIADLVKTAKERLGVSFGKNNTYLIQALKGMTKKGVLSANQRMDGEHETVHVWVMRSTGWKTPPEFAIFTDLLPELLRTAPLELLKEGFDKKEQQGDPKAMRGNLIGEYRHYCASFLTDSLLLASQIPCKGWMQERENRGVALKDEDLTGSAIFERDFLTGEIIITPDVIRGWIKNNGIHAANMPGARARYLAIDPIRFPANTPVIEIVLPVQSDNGPAAPKKYEALLPGLEFDITLSAPVKGFMTPAQLERMLYHIARRPVRGLSPARGTRYGRLIMVGFKQIGLTKSGDMSHLLTGISDAMKKKYPYIEEANARLSKVSLGTPVNAKAMDALEAAEASEDAA